MPQTRARIFDDFARLMTDAAGVAHGVRREAETAVKTQAERSSGDHERGDPRGVRGRPRHGGPGPRGERGAAPPHRRPRSPARQRAEARHLWCGARSKARSPVMAGLAPGRPTPSSASAGWCRPGRPSVRTAERVGVDGQHKAGHDGISLKETGWGVLDVISGSTGIVKLSLACAAPAPARRRRRQPQIGGSPPPSRSTSSRSRPRWSPPRARRRARWRC